mgnify:FL=1
MTTKYCKSCKSNYNLNDFGLKSNGEEYKTCINCRNRNRHRLKEKLCDIEEIKQTFIDLNCNIYNCDKMKWMMELKSYEAEEYFQSIILMKNNVFIERLTKNGSQHILKFLNQVGINIENKPNGCPESFNVIFYCGKTENDIKVVFSKEPINRFNNFMRNEKLKNRRTCELCCVKSKCFRVRGQCEKKQCIQCFKENNKHLINDCPFCRYNFTEHHTKDN